MFRTYHTIFPLCNGHWFGGGVNNSGEKTIFSKLRIIDSTSNSYCIFDVGANQGQFLDLAIQNMKGTNFRIHSFEPSRKTFSILKSKARDNVLFNNFGLGKEQGELTLYYDEEGSGLASLTKRKLEHFGINFSKEEIVAIQTLDFYCDKNNIDHIHLLKVDVEGHELDVFEGASNMFAKKKIDMVTFEFGGCNIDTRTYLQDFWYFFMKQEMDLFRITPSGYLFRLSSYREIYEQFRCTNFIAIRN